MFVGCSNKDKWKQGHIGYRDSDINLKPGFYISV